MGQSGRKTGGRAALQIQAEPELGQQTQLPADIDLRPGRITGHHCAEQDPESLVNRRMRFAFRQRRVSQSARRGQRREPQRIVQKFGCHRAPDLQLPGSKMFRQPRPPLGGDFIAGLQDGTGSTSAAAAHQPGVPSVPARQQVHDRGGLAVPAARQDNTLIGPVHGHILI